MGIKMSVFSHQVDNSLSDLTVLVRIGQNLICSSMEKTAAMATFLRLTKDGNMSCGATLEDASSGL